VKFVPKKGRYDTELCVFWGSLFKIFIVWRRLFWFHQTHFGMRVLHTQANQQKKSLCRLFRVVCG